MRKIFYAFLLFLPLGAFGQQNISGKVTDANDGAGLPGVNVIEKGTSNGTVTDLDGNYQMLVASENPVLVFSYVGYQKEEVLVNGRAVVDVALTFDVRQLGEVVVIGYGTATEKELTGSVGSITAEDIVRINPTRIENALQGQIAGVQISSQSGSPGGEQSIRIRGITTNGDNRPFIIVDGIRYGDDLATIDPNNIETINVLKDATAGIYGVQAANGVIIITTKSGKGLLKPQLSVNSYYGIQETARKIPLLNATEYALLTNEAFANGGQTPPFGDISGFGTGTDWQDEVFESAPIQNHSINYSGATEKSNYSYGGSYFSQEGIVGGDKAKFERINANINSTREIYDRLDLTTNFNYIHTNRSALLENALGSVLFNAINMAPNQTVFDENGEFTKAEGLGIEVINPLAQIANTYDDTKVNRVSGVIGLKYEIIEGLSVESSFNFNYSDVINKRFNPEVDFGVDKVFNTEVSSVRERSQNFRSFNVDNIVHYQKEIIEGHNFKFTLGNSIFKNLGESLEVTGLQVPNNSIDFADISQIDSFDIVDAARSFEFDNRQISYFGRVEYNYQSRYWFSALGRRDATSIFAPGKQVGYFYALSGGWTFTEESFFPSLGFLDYGKLRASYGVTGNDRVEPFGFITLLNGEAEAVFNGNTILSGEATGRIANPDLQWERNVQFDVGLDLDLFDGRIAVTADYYIKTTQDLLLEVPVSALTGVNAPGGLQPFANSGEIRNRGFELQLGYNGNIGSDLDVNVNFNLATLDNEATSVNNGVGFISGGSFGVGQLPPTRFQTGFPIGYFLGLKTDGIFQNSEEVANSAQAGSASPGDIRFVDLNNDNVINEEDRTLIGSPIPDYILGFSLSLSYKNFDISGLVDAQLGNEIVRDYERNLPMTNRTQFFADRWIGPGTSNSFPLVTTGANNNDQFSDFFVESGSYARIKNIQLGYSLPTKAIEKIGATRVRFYGSVNNLFTFTEYQGFDPNVAVRGREEEDAASDPLAAGIDQGFYPVSRAYIFGLNITF